MSVWRLRLTTKLLRLLRFVIWPPVQTPSFRFFSVELKELSLNAMAFILSIHLRGSWMTFGDQKYATKMRPLTFDFGHLGSLV